MELWSVKWQRIWWKSHMGDAGGEVRRSHCQGHGHHKSNHPTASELLAPSYLQQQHPRQRVVSTFTHGYPSLPCSRHEPLRPGYLHLRGPCRLNLTMQFLPASSPYPLHLMPADIRPHPAYTALQTRVLKRLTKSPSRCSGMRTPSASARLKGTSLQLRLFA
jgi:hypothetical protein